MERVKTVLFYLLFWTLAVVLSSLVGISRIVYFAFITLKEFGVNDPQFIAGAISQSIVFWLLFIFVLTVLIYPIYYFLRNKVKYLALFAIIGWGIIIPAIDAVMTTVDLLDILARFVGVAIFTR